MPIFLLFASPNHEEWGGLDDLVGQYPSIEMAREAADAWRLRERFEADAWAHIGRIDSGGPPAVVLRAHWDTSRGYERAHWRWEDQEQPEPSGRE